MTIAEEAPPRLDDFDPQHMSILAWGYATLELLVKNRSLPTWKPSALRVFYHITLQSSRVCMSNMCHTLE